MAKIGKNEQLDVDIRFLLANERTLLSWIRTSLAIEAGGLTLTALHHNQPLFGIIILLLGVVVALIGYHRYRVADESIRAKQLPKSGVVTAMQLYGIVGIAVVIALLQVTIFR
jgi:putative membrane protein